MVSLLDKSSGISRTKIEKELETSYLSYAMSVIVSRALPDLRDGLKPVHRRILYAMFNSGFTHDKQTKKSARIVGEVVGKFHPHGENAVYDAIVRMAQDFSMNLPLIEGQGNFGSVDGDPPAAMRYTEARMHKISSWLVKDLHNNTVDFQPNYEGSELEPSVLPASFPNILVNGANGIAVGMATSIPPFNINEILSACLAIVDDPHSSDEDILSHIKAPDFPTAGSIIYTKDMSNAMREGKGSIVIRGDAKIESIKDKDHIVITSLPYQVNKASLIQKIASLVKEKRIEGIVNIRDESNLNGMRIVIEMKRGVCSDVILNQLYTMTSLQDSFSVIMLCLSDGVPKILSVPDILRCFIEFREEIITKRTKSQLEAVRNKGHILIALAVAASNIDEVINIIQSSHNSQEAFDVLRKKRWSITKDMMNIIDLISDPRTKIHDDYVILSTEQIKSILELKLSKITRLGIHDIQKDALSISSEIQKFLTILDSPKGVFSIMKSEFEELNSVFSYPRRTSIIHEPISSDDLSLIPKEDIILSITKTGYIKRTILSDYKLQKRGGRGRSGLKVSNQESSSIFAMNTHDDILFFSSSGTVYKMPAWRIYPGSLQSKGKHIANFLPLSENEYITSIVILASDTNFEKQNIVFVSRMGYVRKNSVKDFLDVNKKGKIAMRLDKDDSIVSVFLCESEDSIAIFTKKGKSIHFLTSNIRLFSGRNSRGVTGIRLRKDDTVVSGFSISEKQRRDNVLILTMTDTGYGKRTFISEYRLMNRGCSGVICHAIHDDENIVNSFTCCDASEIMTTTTLGNVIRSSSKDIRISGRSTRGVRVVRLHNDDKAAYITNIDESFISDD